MHATKFPLGVRLLGFAAVEAAEICDTLAEAPAGGPRYVCLNDASLQEPELLIANGDNLKAITDLVACNPGPLLPALVIGTAAADIPYLQLPRPVKPQALRAFLDGLAEERAVVAAKLGTRRLPVVPERRRRPRLDLDLTDPAEYALRRRAPSDGAVLIVDQRGALRDHLARLLGPRQRAVEWTDSAEVACRLCEETPVAMVMINTSLPRLDPYGLCAQIKALPGGARIAVVLLVGPSHPYDAVRGKAADVRGILDKPMADRHLMGVMKKLLSLPS